MDLAKSIRIYLPTNQNMFLSQIINYLKLMSIIFFCVFQVLSLYSNLDCSKFLSLNLRVIQFKLQQFLIVEYIFQKYPIINA